MLDGQTVPACSLLQHCLLRRRLDWLVVVQTSGGKRLGVWAELSGNRIIHESDGATAVRLVTGTELHIRRTQLASFVGAEAGEPKARICRYAGVLGQIQLPGYAEAVIEPGEPPAKSVISKRHERFMAQRCRNPVNFFFRLAGDEERYGRREAERMSWEPLNKFP
jgi:hypothetical protein